MAPLCSLWASNLAPYSLQNRFKNHPGFRLRFGHDSSANVVKNRRFQNQSRPARSLIGLGFYESDLHFQLLVFTRSLSLVLNDFGLILFQSCSLVGSILASFFIQNGCSKSMSKLIHFCIDFVSFWLHFGSLWTPLGAYFRLQGGEHHWGRRVF